MIHRKDAAKEFMKTMDEIKPGGGDVIKIECVWYGRKSDRIYIAYPLCYDGTEFGMKYMDAFGDRWYLLGEL